MSWKNCTAPVGLTGRQPISSTMSGIGWVSSFLPSIKREQIEGLHELGFIEPKENVVILRPPGVGNTYIAISLPIAAAQGRRRVK